MFLIVDGHLVHRSAKVRNWALRHSDQLRLFHLPTYCPELNPDELLNQDAGRCGGGGAGRCLLVPASVPALAGALQTLSTLEKPRESVLDLQPLPGELPLREALDPYERRTSGH